MSLCSHQSRTSCGPVHTDPTSPHRTWYNPWSYWCISESQQAKWWKSRSFPGDFRGERFVSELTTSCCLFTTISSALWVWHAAPLWVLFGRFPSWSRPQDACKSSQLCRHSRLPVGTGRQQKQKQWRQIHLFHFSFCFEGSVQFILSNFQSSRSWFSLN